MHYIKFIMKNIVFSLIKYLYYFSFTAMIILYLFPGSLIGFLLYEDFARQPDLIANPIGTSINHLLAFLYLSLLGFIKYFHKKKLFQILMYFTCLSIILELSHFLIPNRSFQLLDLFGNLIGTLFSFFIVIFYQQLKEDFNVKIFLYINISIFIFSLFTF